ncbi:acyltransferase family protein [Arthrobacter parietis]|uniref:Acyltransferase family protein n=1 Tax=Arthrobacter parietis TaxID=271434 RepID=A0ABP5MG05_9MICC
MRALAVLMVVVYHIWFDRVSGGVDVFLLISSFLLTLTFIRKAEQGSAFGLAQYWLQLFKRLLPAVVFVLLATLAATYLFVPESRWQEIFDQTWASLFYVQNWLLAERSVDYYAADEGLASPLQHFWSLSVQGQVFLLWPLLFAVSAVLARVAHLRFRPVAGIIFGAIFCASLAYSVAQTYTNQSYAYFDTRARLWEFALGTLLALILPYVSIPRVARIIAGWVALAAVLSGGFLLDVEREFPGFVALWPLLAAGTIMVAGNSGSRFGVDAMLSWKPLVRLGDISYALYLWHWPILVIYLTFRDRSEAGPLSGAAIIALSLVLAYLTTRFIENPVRHRLPVTRRVAAIAVTVCCLTVAVPLSGWQFGLKVQTDRANAQTVSDNPGARVLAGIVESRSSYEAPIVPSAATINGEWASLAARCSDAALAPAEEVLNGHCSDNGIDPSVSDRTVVVVGDSHAEQWLGVMRPLAAENNWTLVALLYGGCDFGVPLPSQEAGCQDFNRAALSYIENLAPDAIFTVVTDAHPDTAEDTVVPGFPAASRQLQGQGIEVIGIRDNPRYSFNMMSCLEESGGIAECGQARSETLTTRAPFDAILNIAPETVLLDATDLICSEFSCDPIVGNMHVYIDDNHLTETYVESMYPVFSDMFRQATGWEDIRD